jgi:hypothetical protein
MMHGQQNIKFRTSLVFFLTVIRFMWVPRPRRLNGLSYALTSFEVDRYGSIVRSLKQLYSSVIYPTKHHVHVPLLLSVVNSLTPELNPSA